MSGSWNSQLVAWMRANPYPTSSTVVTEPVLLDFKTAFLSASGDTALWTPAAGKAVRITKLSITAPNNTTKTAGNNLNVTLKGTSKVWAVHTLWIPSTLGALLTAPGAAGTGNINLGPGFKAAVDEVISINLSTSVDTGGIRINAWGLEE